MSKKGLDMRALRQRPLLTLPQIVVLLVIVAAIVIALDLNQRAQAGRNAGAGVEAIEHQVSQEETRAVQLQATLDYVNSDDYVAQYARDEAGMILPGEQRIAPLLVEATPEPTPLPAPTADPAVSAYPWQAWWRLLSDAPPPTR